MSLEPVLAGDYISDLSACTAYWRQSRELLAALPPKPERKADAASLAAALIASARVTRAHFLALHARALYDRLTQDRTLFPRINVLLERAADAAPGLVPDDATLAKESALNQSEKDGHEVDQGLFLSHVLGDAVTGEHLCHAMLLPRAESLALLPEFERTGRVDLGAAIVERRGRKAIVTTRNPRFLNSEDNGNLDACEIAADLCLLDKQISICILRGDRVEHAKYAGRRVFDSGINLTHLYRGKIPYEWFPRRELGFISKLWRGLAKPDVSPDEILGDTIEKPWIAQLDTFAIGGGCQILLVCDYTVAASDAYLTLPARKEGIIPGFANLRLPRFVGDRIARQAIQYERRIDCNSDAGRMICDEIVAPDATEAATEAVADRFLDSGQVGAISNRRALRIGQETLDLTRRYAAYYARAQAECHFSPQLIDNLERYWDARNRKA
jgi:(3,5-dihydroxyphenyl)acetyl-CoA 1,2-dioxygenase